MVSLNPPGSAFTVLTGDCREQLGNLAEASVDLIFADPPYNLSSGGMSCSSGRAVCVDKGDWDKSEGFERDFQFTQEWISACKRVLKEDGTIWISGTPHSTYRAGFALQSMGFHVINEISWYKPNAPPNLACRCFAHAHETILWAKKSKDAKHCFNYKLMKEWDDRISPSGKQMRSVWVIPLTPQQEKKHGKHPTQKPLELLHRIIASSSRPGAIVLDPFSGSGTTGVAALMLGRKYIGIEKQNAFVELSMKRMNSASSLIKATEQRA